jgi:cytochrome c biogenesis protein CcdA
MGEILADTLTRLEYLGTMANQSQLEMIQGIINRLAGNSSAFKGWMVTITAALLGVAINNHKPWLAWLAVYAICVLAFLDAYYLGLERSYRNLYSQEAAQTAQDRWSLSAQGPGLATVLAAIKSPSVWPFYGSALIVAIIAGVRL